MIRARATLGLLSASAGLLLPFVASAQVDSIAISEDQTHACAVLADGAVKCWGHGFSGALGIGSTDNRGDAANEMGVSLPYVDLGPGKSAALATVGDEYSCAILNDATVKCWGDGLNGKRGSGDTTDIGDAAGEMGSSLATVSLGTSRTALHLDIGSKHTCVLLDNNTVKCWGKNTSGRLGIGDTSDRGDAANEMGDSLPTVSLGTGRTGVTVAAGIEHTCALLDNSTLKCWGEGSSGQLGQGNTNDLGDGANEMGDNLSTISLGTGRTAVDIAAGAAHSCAILDNGSVKCWGLNTEGRLGLGDTTTRGDGANEMGDSLPTVSLGTGRTATDIDAGDNFVCALLDNGSIKCWGENISGQLGLGDTNDRGDGANEMGDNLPTVSLGTGRTAIALATGNSSACAVLDNGTVKCWGDSSWGELGYGNTNSIGDGANEMGDNLAAVLIGSPVRVASGDIGACAERANATVKCWGSNTFGDLGLGDTVQRGDGAGEMGSNLPTVDLGSGFNVSISRVGSFHRCAVSQGGSVKCWGENSLGQLGLGDTSDRGDAAGEMGSNLPSVDLGSGTVAIDLGFPDGNFDCALLSGGTVKCWGSNNSGQLGLGDTNNRGDGSGEMGASLPTVSLGTGRSAKQVSAGNVHACVLLDNDTVKCWGNNLYGQLGLGDTANRGDGAREMGDNLPTVSLGTGRTAVQIRVGSYDTCVLLDNDTVKCWGMNSSGQLGLGDTANRGDGANEMGDNLPTVSLGTSRVAKRIDPSYSHTCAILDNGSMKCWGFGNAGRLGLGDQIDRGDGSGEMGDNLPTIDLGSGRVAMELSTGPDSTCAVLDDNSIKCWGSNGNGQLGLGDTNNRGDGANEMGGNLPTVDLGP